MNQRKPFRSGIPEHVPPLRPQTANRRGHRDIIIEEKNTFAKPQRPPTNMRNKVVKAAVSKPEPSQTPRRAGPAAPTVTSAAPATKRPTTAQPARRQGGRVAPSKEMPEKIDTDYESQAAKVRAEISKEFGISVNEKEVEQPWLNEISNMQDKLNENVYQSSIMDESPLALIDQVSNKVISNTTSLDDPFKSAKKILDESFAQFDEIMAEEKKLLDERIELLQKFGHELMLHPASEYTADTKQEEADDLPKPQPIIIQTKARPSTARAPTRDFH